MLSYHADHASLIIFTYRYPKSWELDCLERLQWLRCLRCLDRGDSVHLGQNGAKYHQMSCSRKHISDHLSNVSNVSNIAITKKNIKKKSAFTHLHTSSHIFTHPQLGPLTCIAGRITGPGEGGLMALAGLQQTATDCRRSGLESSLKQPYVPLDTIGIHCILLLPFCYGIVDY